MNENQFKALKQSMQVLATATMLYHKAVAMQDEAVIKKALRYWNANKKLYFFAYGYKRINGYKGIV